MSDSPAPCPWQLAEGSIGDRVVFTHNPILHSQEEESSSGDDAPNRITIDESSNDGSGAYACVKSSFALVTILSEPLGASVTAGLVQPPSCSGNPVGVKGHEENKGKTGQGGGGQIETDKWSKKEQQPKPGSQAGVAAILGPVVGRVEVVAQSGVVRESCRVPVVLEVDGAGEVTCVVSFRHMLSPISKQTVESTGGVCSLACGRAVWFQVGPRTCCKRWKT